MRGGFRPGAGRKPGEPTVRLRVPLGAVPAVQAVIEAHKNSGASIKPRETAGVSDFQETGPQIEQSQTALDVSRRLKSLERLPSSLAKKFRVQVGKFKEAALRGWVASGRSGKNLKVFNEKTGEVWNG